jgi:hypothetical protein
MGDNSKLIESLKEAGLELGEPIEGRIDPVIHEKTLKFIRTIEEAYENARNSKLKFDAYSLATAY